MSKIEKLIQKLKRGSIDARELRALMVAMGAKLVRQGGSHEFWVFEDRAMVLAAHGNDLKMYNITQARRFLNV